MRHERTSGVTRPFALAGLVVVSVTVWLFASTVGADLSGPLAPQTKQISEVATGDVGTGDVGTAGDVSEPARFDRGIPWAPVTPFVDLGEGGVAGVEPECFCDQDCDLGDPCAGGICTDGVCTADPASANGSACDDGNADGLFCTIGLCSEGTCLVAQGGDAIVCSGEAETCNDTDDRCENCAVDADCPADGIPDVCAPEICDPTTKRCVLDFANLPCPEQNCDDEDEPGVANCTGAIDEGRCCLPDNTCVEDQTRAECDLDSGIFMTLSFCPCPKYGAGIAPDNVAQGQSNTVFELLIEPAGACQTRSLLGDDYTLSNSSFLTLELTTITGVIEANNTNLAIKYYDADRNLILTDPVLNLDAGPIIFASAPIGAPVIPSIGWVTIEVTTDTGGFLWRSTDEVDVGLNNKDLLWEDNTQGQILPAGLNVMRLEITGTKTQPPLGVCCSGDGKTCTTDQLPWQCGDGSHVLGGSCPASCEVGSCCLANGFCCDPDSLGDDPGCTLTAISSQLGCEADGGSFNGFATDCSLDCCLQTFGGADVCANAADHPLDVSGGCVIIDNVAVCPTDNVTISGDNRDVTNGTCDMSGTPCATNTIPGQPVSCPKGEVCEPNANHCSALGGTTEPIPVYYEKFSINNWSNVAIDYCGSGTCPGVDPGPGALGGGFVRYIIILDGCQVDGDLANCGDFIFRDLDLSATVICEDQNAADIYANLAPGTYWAPVFSGKTCEFTTNSCLVNEDCADDETCINSEMNYQMHIVATALPPQACCLVVDNAPVCSELPKPKCESFGGFSSDNSPTCFPLDVCELGACCTGPGECEDAAGAGTTLVACDLLAGEYFGAARCNDDPCPVCTIDDPANCQFDTGGFILNVDRAVNDEGAPDPHWADDFRPGGIGPVPIDTICWNPCFFNPFTGAECTDDPPPDDFEITIYNDAGGLPGTEVAPGTQPLNLLAKESAGTGSRCWNYAGTPSSPPIVNGGGCYWIQITGRGQGPDDGGCTVYWLTSNDGNHYFAFDNDGTWGAEDVILDIGGDPLEADLSFCLNTGLDGEGCGTFTGACCICGSDCLPNSDANTCADLGGHFFPGQACNGLLCPEDIVETLANDDCSAAELLEHPVANAAGGGDPLPIVVDFDTRCATTDGPDTPFEACQDTAANGASPFVQDLWYEYHPPCCGTLRASMCPLDGTGANALYDSQLVLYGGVSTCSCPDDATVAIQCSDSGCGIGTGPSLIEETIFEGNCYLLRVGGAPDAGVGTLVVSITCGECPAEVGRPNPNPELGLGVVAGATVQPCVTLADCDPSFGLAPNVDCIPQPNGLLPGTCYTSAARYLSISPNPENVTATARRVTLDIPTCSASNRTCGSDADCGACSNGGSLCSDASECGECSHDQSPCTINADCGAGNSCLFLATCDPTGETCFANGLYDVGLDHVLGWMDEPFSVNVVGPEPSPQALARISSTSNYRIWGNLTDINAALTGKCSVTGDPCAVDADCPQVGTGEVCDGPPVHLGDCEIAPGGEPPATTGNTYFVQAINQGDDEASEANYSVPLRLRTVTRHADVAGIGVGTDFPNQNTGLADAFKIVLGFQGNQTLPKWRLDQTGGQITDNVPNIFFVSLLDVFQAVVSFQSGGGYGFEQPCDCPGQSCP